MAIQSGIPPFLTRAWFPDWVQENLDPNLSRLVERMCAVQRVFRPNLQDLRQGVLEGVQREPEDYALYPRPGDPYESDEFIQEICRKYIMDAPAEATDDEGEEGEDEEGGGTRR